MAAQTQKKTLHARKRSASQLDARTAVVKTNADVVKMATLIAQARTSDRAARVAQAAYFLAEKRGFAPGHELEDWLAAECEIVKEQLEADGSGSAS